MYGAYHQRRLATKEVKVREIEAKQKEIRDAKLAIERKRNQEGKQMFQLPKFVIFSYFCQHISVEIAAIAALSNKWSGSSQQDSAASISFYEKIKFSPNEHVHIPVIVSSSMYEYAIKVIVRPIGWC